MRARWLAAGICLVALAATVSACGGSSGGGGSSSISGNTLTIWASVPLQGGSGDQGKAIENGAGLAVDEVGGKVGKYTIKYKRLDDSLASTGAADEGKGSQNARQAVADKTTIGYLGEYNSGISKVTIPILNQGGVMQISPSNTYVGLTSSAPGHEPGEPDKYYPTGKRTYARVVPIDTVQAAAVSIVMKNEGCKSVTVWNSKTTYSAGLATNVKQTAPKAGVQVLANVGYDPKAANYRSLASNIKSDCFLSTGEIEQNANQGLKDVAATKPNVKIFETDGDCLNASADPSKGVPPSVAPKFQCTIATLDPKTFGPEGKKFFDTYSKKYHVPSPDPYAIYGYESMKLLLDSIKTASANGTKSISRQDVVNEVFKTKNRKSVLGTYSINKDGDTSLTDYGLYKIVSGQLTFDQVIKTQSLLGTSGASG